MADKAKTSAQEPEQVGRVVMKKVGIFRVPVFESTVKKDPNAPMGPIRSAVVTALIGKERAKSCGLYVEKPQKEEAPAGESAPVAEETPATA